MPSDAAGAGEAPASSKEDRPLRPLPSRRRAFLWAGLATAATWAVVFAVWPATERDDLRQGPALPDRARLRGPERPGAPLPVAGAAETHAVPGDADADAVFTYDVPTGQLPPALRSLRWSMRGVRGTLSARLAMAQPGRYAAYAELAFPTDRAPAVVVFSRARLEVPNETGADIFLTFSPIAFRNLNSTSQDVRSIYLRKFLVKRVDHHPSSTVAEVAGLTLFAVKEAASGPAKNGSMAVTGDSSAPRD